MRTLATAAAALVTAAVLSAGAVPHLQQPPATPLDRAATRWVDETMKKMTLDDKVGQLVFTLVYSTYLSSDSDAFEAVAQRIADLKLGGVLLLGGREPAPGQLLNSAYGSVILGQPLAAASLLNRLQARATIPLLATADFEAGAGFRIHGATAFPRQMAVAAGGDDNMASEVARITAIESRAMGIHVNFSPLADVNNNARNPVINTRSFGERPEMVGRLAAAYVRGYREGGVLSTIKHFPGHGDTEADSHLGLPVIQHPRERLQAIELPPFVAGIESGADAVMTGHIQLPALDSGEFSPATLSKPIVQDLLRGELKFQGLIFTDSMDMDAIVKRLPPGDAAVRAVQAGNDVVLNSTDDAAAVTAIKLAVERGEIPAAQIDASVRRLLQAKARLGLHKARTVPLDEVPAKVGGRQHAKVAEEVSARSITLVKDDRNQVPLRAPREASILYLSMLDYPSGWRIAAPSRTFLPELRKRWPAVTAIELSDRSTSNEIDLVRATAARYDAIVASVFVRAASGSGRMDLSPALLKLLADLSRQTTGTAKPLITVFFGNPYIALGAPTLPAVMLTYDLCDLAELSAVRALAGETPIGGHLPISLPGMFEAGFGIVR
jgi:beta-glucosidase-like glycosyl hydrolase